MVSNDQHKKKTISYTFHADNNRIHFEHHYKITWIQLKLMNENLNEFNRMKLNWENKRNFCKKKKMNFQVLFFFQIVDRLSSNR